jgi:hypothetical protein
LRLRQVKSILLLATLAMCWGAPRAAFAQQASGSLAVTAAVQSSVSLTFENHPNVGTPGYCPLINAGTNNVALNLGSASHVSGATLACVNFIPNIGASFYEISSAFDLVVTKANSPSPNYRVLVSMSAVPPANVIWVMNSLVMTTAAQTLQAGNLYGRTTETLRVRVKNSVPAQVLAETIFFTAVAN